MAGVEKICQLSGVYECYKMRAFSKDSIQVSQKEKKKFRKAEHKIYIEFNEMRWHTKNSKLDSSRAYEKTEMLNYNLNFENEKDFINFMKDNNQFLSLVKQYSYLLDVRDPCLKGIVNGQYLGTTMCISRFKRKMKRMLRCKKLNLIFVEDISSYYN